MSRWLLGFGGLDVAMSLSMRNVFKTPIKKKPLRTAPQVWSEHCRAVVNQPCRPTGGVVSKGICHFPPSSLTHGSDDGSDDALTRNSAVVRA